MPKPFTSLKKFAAITNMQVAYNRNLHPCSKSWIIHHSCTAYLDVTKLYHVPDLKNVKILKTS